MGAVNLKGFTVGDSSTSVRTVNSDPAPSTDETIIVHSPAPDGFVLLYHDIAHRLIGCHGTVIDVYLALGTYSNAERKCHPTLAQLREVVNAHRKSNNAAPADLIAHTDTIKRALAELERRGLLRIDRPSIPGRGRASSYFMTRPEKAAQHAAYNQQDRLHDRAEKAAPAMHPQQETKQQEITGTRTRTHARESAPISSTIATPDTNRKEGGSETQTKTAGVSTSSATLSPEYRQAYWQDPAHGELRTRAFKGLLSLWPRPDGEQSAAAAWRQTIGTSLDEINPTNHATYAAMCHAAEWYHRKCDGKLPGTSKEDGKWIEPLDKWIRRSGWFDAPEHIRQGKANP